MTSPTSGFAAACPRLTELTIFPYPLISNPMTAGISELVVACRALPDFDTLQILHFPAQPPPTYWSGNYVTLNGRWEQSLRHQANCVRDLVIDCLRSPKLGCEEGEGRKRTMVKIVRLSSVRSRPHPDPGFVKVEVLKV